MNLTYNLSEIDVIAQKLLSQAKCKEILFFGDMGVGKTTLIKALAASLGIREATTSPTFSLVNEYQNTQGQVIFHFDFYRIENPEEVLDMGLEYYLEQGDYIFIEWPEKVNEYLPSEVTEVHLSQKNNGLRALYLKNKC